MAVATERYVHFLLDSDGKPPQRCRVSSIALATLEGVFELTADRDQSMRLFMKHRRMVEAIARMKLSRLAEPPKWVTIAAEELDLTP